MDTTRGWKVGDIWCQPIFNTCRKIIKISKKGFKLKDIKSKKIINVLFDNFPHKTVDNSTLPTPNATSRVSTKEQISHALGIPLSIANTTVEMLSSAHLRGVTLGQKKNPVKQFEQNQIKLKNRTEWTETNIPIIILSLKNGDNVLVRVMEYDKIIEEGIVDFYSDRTFKISVNQQTFAYHQPQDEPQDEMGYPEHSLFLGYPEHSLFHESWDIKKGFYKYYYIVRPENINIKPITFEQIKKLKKQCTFNILVTHYDKTITWLDNNDIDEININDINIDDIELDVKYYMLSDSSYTQSCSVSGGKRTRKIVKKNNKKSRSKRFFQKNKF